MYITHMQQVFKSHAATYTAADPKLHCDSTLVLKRIYVDRITGLGDLMAPKMNEKHSRRLPDLLHADTLC